MKLKLISITATIFALFMLFIPNTAKAQEQKYEELKAELSPQIEEMLDSIPEDSKDICIQNLVPLFDANTALFLQFLDSHYQNKTINSSINKIAAMKFFEYKKTMYLYLDQIKISDKYENYQENLDEYNQCYSIYSAYIDTAKQKMIEHTKSTSYQKSSTMLIEKYQSINDQMRDLNFNIAQIYGYFMTFKDKFPGFIPICIKE